MNKIKQSALFGTAALIYASIISGGSAFAQGVDLSNPDAIADYANFNGGTENNLDAQLPQDSMGQVTNVNQLRDVAPTDWAYEALRSLVDRYGCISGFPNQTYRGSQPLSRYEFAAGLNSCLNQIERLIASGEGANEEDLESIQRLSQEFEAELATIGGRVDEIESRTAVLEDSQFSTTTQLQGEVVLQIADVFSDDDDLNVETVFNERVRLQLVSSFTGKDKLFTRLTTGNIGNSFQDELGTREGRFAYDGPGDNDIVLDRLHYQFPLGENLQVTAMASLGAHHFYTETFNSGLDVGGGGNGALSRFGERNPIYRQGIGNSTSGLGATYSFGEKIELSAGYIAPSGSDPTDENGLFNGSFSALGQIAIQPFEKLKVGATYVRSYDNDAAVDDDDAEFRPAFLFGGTGTNAGNLRGVGVDGVPVATNSIGAQFQFDFSEKLSLRGWGGYTDAEIINAGDDNNGSATIWNYAAAVVVSDLIKEGNLGAIIVGAEPYLTAIDADGAGGDEPVTNDVPIHIEALYKYQFSDNISFTPGIIWLSAPNQNTDNDDAYIGTLRTTFSF